MGEPIRSRRLGDLAGAPTPQNTPATAASSFAQRAAASRPTVAPIAEEASALAGLSNNPALLSMIQGKLNTLVGRPSGYVESLPRVVRDRLAGLRAIQDEHSKLEYEFLLELVALEKKYFTKYEPLYKRRAQIVSGEIEPTEDEIEKGHTLEKEDGDGFSDDDEERIKEVDEDAEGDGKVCKCDPN
jgi:nucleosome assembly protein 1-like 1